MTRKQALFTLNNDGWQNRKKKVHFSVLLIRPPAWMFPAGARKQTTKSGQCHPGYKGKHCETRRW